VRGGSSAINGMLHVRGNARDYDEWARLGASGWSYAEVLPYFRRSERCEGGESAYRGASGPLPVRRQPRPSAAALAFVESAKALGYPRSDPGWDFNGAQQEEAAAVYEVTVTAAGLRASAAVFLDSLHAAARPETKTGVRVTRIVIEGGRAMGVECLEQGARTIYRAGAQVIIAAGAFESPKLLMLSGIGPADELRALGIAPVADLPGVGENLCDHLQILVYFPARRDPGVAGFIAEAGLFLRTREGPGSPDLQYHVLGSLPALAARAGSHVLICPVLVKPASRGRLWLRSADPADDPRIDPGYLERDADLDVLGRGARLAHEFAVTAPLSKFCGERPFAYGGAAKLDLPEDGAALREFVRATARTAWHPVGTCRMGEDAAAVVDARLRVRGVDRLRVADASVMPVITSGNTNAPALMIGERCADFVLQGC
jgi:choline dehydrogenase